MQNSISRATITEGLRTRFIGQRLIYYRRLGSTMEAARREVERGAVAGTVIVAGEQSAGRGRMRRMWLSPRGSISLSVILYPEVAYLPSLIMLAPLAVVRSIESVTGLKSAIKWPNDVLVNNKKVCGVLIESDVRGNRVDCAIIGIGINVNFNPDEFPEIAPIATSLSHELGRDISRLAVIRCLLVESERLYLALQAGDSIYEEWRDNVATLGQQVRVTSGETTYEGVAESVARDGSLLLRRQDGTLARIVAGDVTLRTTR